MHLVPDIFAPSPSDTMSEKSEKPRATVPGAVALSVCAPLLIFWFVLVQCLWGIFANLLGPQECRTLSGLFFGGLICGISGLAAPGFTAKSLAALGIVLNLLALFACFVFYAGGANSP